MRRPCQRETPAMLLAWLSASPAKRKEMVLMRRIYSLYLMYLQNISLRILEFKPFVIIHFLMTHDFCE